MNSKKNNVIFLFIERKSIIYVEVLYCILVLIFLINSDSSLRKSFVSWYDKFLAVYNSELVTIATVLIGIHFTVYTLLMSASSSSTYSKLSANNKKTLLKILNHSFVFSFLYVIYSLTHKSFSNLFPLGSTLIILGILIIMLYSSFIFGITIYRIIKNDILNEIKINDDKDIWDD